MSADNRKFWRDDSGAVMLEFTAAALMFFSLLFGVIEFANVYYQWNAATKAVQFGARLAAVSEPAVTNFRDFTGLSATVLPGDPLPADAYDYTCTSDSSATDCQADALRLLVFGRCDPARETCATGTISGESVSIRTSCAPNPTPANIGMCNIFPRINNINQITVRYEYTGLGYAGRPGGPVPTITVGLRNINYDFILLAAFLPTNSIAMPSFATTVTGEDLNVAWSNG